MCTVFNSQRLYHEVGRIFRVRKWWRVLKELLEGKSELCSNIMPGASTEGHCKKQSHEYHFAFVFKLLERLLCVLYGIHMRKVLEFSTPGGNIAFSGDLEWFLYFDHKTYINYSFPFTLASNNLSKYS